MGDLNEAIRHRILVVGVGSIGERHVRCFQRTGRARISICEPNDELREEVATRYEIENRYADLEHALQQPHDAAVIAVPAALHVSLAKTLAASGLHLLIEKPLSISTDGIDELFELILQKRCKVSVGYVHRAHPCLAAMKDAISSGSLGAPLEMVVVAGQHFPTFRPAYRQTYYVSHATGGGAIQDAMTHLVNAGEWLLGPIDRIVADADHRLLAGVDVEDVVHCLARHGPVLASYSLNQFQSPNEVTFTVVCEHGTARFEYHRNRWRRMTRPNEDWVDECAEGLERDTLFLRQADRFLDTIDRQSTPLCSLEDGLQSLRVNLAMLRSVENGAWCRIN